MDAAQGGGDMSALDFPLQFLRPWWWLALAPLPVVLWMLARSGGRAAFARLADTALLPHLVRDGGTRKRGALALVALAWLVAVASLSGPAWQKVAAPLYVNGAARVIALSLSDHMLAADLKPDRMTRARYAVRDLLNAAGDARTALVAYAGAAFTVAPLTNDKHTVMNLLRVLQPDVMPVPGNDAASGIRRSVELLGQSRVEGGEIVLVTDTADEAAVAAARNARAKGIRVDVLGIGTTQGAPVPRQGGGFADGAHGPLMARRDDAALRAVADAGGGHYVVLQAGGGGVAALAAPQTETGHASHGERAQLWRDGGVWLLPALLVFAALAFRRGWLMLIAVCLLPMVTRPAHAANWESLFANRDQRALHALQDGDAVQARKLATSPAVKGAAEYRAGDFAAAAKAFAQGDDARSRYNLGNALAKQGKYAKAITAYKDALQRDPKLADARANLNAVEDWLKRHAKPEPQQGQGGEGAKNDQRNQPSAAQDSGSGSRADKGQNPSQAGSSRQPSSSANSASSNGGGTGAQADRNAQQQGGGRYPMPSGDNDGASAGEEARQREQSKHASQALSRELQRASGNDRRADDAFALGQDQPGQDDRFNAEQRAMLHAVPDDPGALLRRKFRLEWEQRNGHQQEDREP
jgi:Ca-activated chloride channel family protein